MSTSTTLNQPRVSIDTQCNANSTSSSGTSSSSNLNELTPRSLASIASSYPGGGYSALPQSARPLAVIDAVTNIWAGNIKMAFEQRTEYCRLYLDKNPTHGLFGTCINKIRNLNLHECACIDFDRLRDSTVRTHYEDRVIQSVINKASAQVKESGRFSINLSFYCPGKLGGETVLCTRLFKELSNLSFEGIFNFTLIESEYQGKDRTFDLAVKEFQQILGHLQSKAPGIEVGRVDFFIDVFNYVVDTKKINWKYDFFLGSDLGYELPDSLTRVFDAVKKDDAVMIILYSEKNQVKLWVNGGEEILRDIPQSGQSGSTEASKRLDISESSRDRLAEAPKASLKTKPPQKSKVPVIIALGSTTLGIGLGMVLAHFLSRGVKQISYTKHS